MLPTSSTGDEPSPPPRDAAKRSMLCWESCRAGGVTGEYTDLPMLSGLGPEALALLGLLPAEASVVGG